MNKRMYATLSGQAIKKQPYIYYPFMILGTAVSAIFFILHSLSINTDLDQIRGGESLRSMLGFGTWVVAIFSVIIFFYGNSIIAKKRNREIGIYTVLGMERRHIRKTLLLQQFQMFLINIVMGITIGIVLNQLALLSLLKMMDADFRLFAGISIYSILLTVAIFFLLYLITVLYTLFKINTAYPVSLISSESEGEKPPKARWLLAILGFGCLGVGYAMAITIEDPAAAMALFFVAVVLVIIGTYSLFSFGSTVVLNMLSKSDSFYYKKNNFISISGMKYRIKQNAAGLASVCILSTCVMVILSTTASMYVGTENSLRSRYPKDMSIRVVNSEDEKIEEIDNIIDKALKKYHLKKESSAKFFMLPNIDFTSNIAKRTLFITIDEHNKLTGENLFIEQDEVLVSRLYGEKIPNTISIGEKEYKIKKEIDLPNNAVIRNYGEDDTQTDYIVMKDEKIALDVRNVDFYEEDKDTRFYYYYNFDLLGNKQDKKGFGIQTEEELMSLGKTYSENIDEKREGFYANYGGLLFLGIFLGLLFLITTIIIIFYKQISEGYQDKRRFNIMKNVGMSNSEIKKAIKVQVLQVFFSPLIISVLHIAFAFPMIYRICKLINVTNIGLLAICTVVVIVLFSMLYAISYIQTSKVYYKIISQEEFA